MTSVLVVDDSAVDRRLIGELLARQPECQVEFAADGVEALARLKTRPPSLIITDLLMPNMDGLELVGAVRAGFPAVPVILTTAHGSEVLAVRALKLGAAGYVPKTLIAEMLLDTVADVLALARANREHERLIRRLDRSGFTFFLELENDRTQIDPVVELVKHAMACLCVCDLPARIQVGVALREALLNAMFHGNLEIGAEPGHGEQSDHAETIADRLAQPRYRDRRVLVDVKISPNEARFVIRDEGPGFDVTALPDPLKSTSGEDGPGRGLPLMLTFMDEVTFNDVGNEVTMVKRREGAIPSAGMDA